MTNYEQLKKKICEALPRLMELKPYNEIFIPQNNGQLFSYTIINILESNTYLDINKTWEGDIIHEEMTEIVTVKNIAISYKLERYAVKDCVWNGIEPTLSDVLMYLGTISGDDDFRIYSDGSIQYWDSLYSDYYTTKPRWNLSQPLLKDQSEELIDYLLGL